MTTANRKVLSYGKQSIGREEIRETVAVLHSDWLSQGPKIAEFEQAFADYCGSKYAVAVANGTAALHLACLAAGLNSKAEAITTPITFLATSNSVAMTTAKPVFADIEYGTANINPSEIKKKIRKKTKAILPVHFGGLPVNLKEIAAIAKKHKLIVIEDGCHALGAEYEGSKIGSCKYSDMTCFSFHPVKHITTGEGGMITTNSDELYAKLKTLRTHGIIKNESISKRSGRWYMEAHELGYNYRITDIQSAMGIAQLKKLDGFVKRRIAIAKKYDAGLSSLGNLVMLPKTSHKDRKHSWHLYLLRLNQAKISRRELFDRLWDEGMHLQVHYIPIPAQPFYKKVYKTNVDHYPAAKKYYEETISLPMYPALKDSDIKRVIEAVKRIILSKESK